MFLFLASGCSSAARNGWGWGEGGSGGGAAPRADGGNSGLGVEAVVGGSTVEGSSTSLRTALHTISLILQNSLS